MKSLSQFTSRFIPSSILIFALTLSGCGGGGDSTPPNTPPTSTASSVSSAVVSNSASSAVISSSSLLSSSSLSSNTSNTSSSFISSSSSSSSSSITTSSSSSTNSSSSSTTSSAPPAKTGVFIDSAVAGIHYQTSPTGFSGNTNAKGEYQYAEGDTVIFSVGSLKFPAVTAKVIVTPLDIANSSDPQNQIALNIAALLQSLDIDGDPDNGISIDYDLAAAQASAVNFDLPYETFATLPAVVNLTANSGSSIKVLVSKTQALAHMQTSLTKIDTAPLIGTWYFSGIPEGMDLSIEDVLFILDSSHFARVVYIGGNTVFSHGTYRWNKTTTELVFEGVASVSETNPSGNAFLSTNYIQFSTDGNFIMRNEGNGWSDITQTFSKLASTTNPLVGGWGGIIGDDVVVFAFTNTHYFHGQTGAKVFDGEGNLTGAPGAEYGTYSNSTSGFTVQTLADTNLQWGFSHPCNIVESHMSQAANDYSCMGGDKNRITVSGDILDFYSAANVVANENNPPPRNNEPEHYYFNRVMKIDSIIFGLPNPLTGSWTLNGDTFIFSGDNKFTHIKAFGSDPNCGIGIATGTYTWNAETSEFNVTLFSDSTGGGISTTCSVGGLSKLILNSKTITLISDDEYVFTKDTSITEGIIGGWALNNNKGTIIIFFTDTHYFLSDYDYQNDDDGAKTGNEMGTYIYDAGMLTVNILINTDGTGGLSDTDSYPIPLSISGDNLTIEESAVFKRLK
jgi:hypothetical protein